MLNKKKCYKNKESFAEGLCQHQRHHNYLFHLIIIYVGIFLMLFLRNFKAGVLYSLTVSLFDVIIIVAFFSLFVWIFNKKYIKFRILDTFLLFIFLFLLIILLYYFELFIIKFINFTNEIDQNFKYISLIKNTIMVFCSVIGALLYSNNNQKKKTENLAYEKQNLELRFLKAQINPHFVFNMLNNIYSLVYTKNPAALEVILRFSDLLRYVTDEWNEDLISIEKEIRYINNYLDLQLLRSKNRQNVTIEYDIDNYSVKIPPMILQSIIENAFKHSDFGTNKEGFIYFCLTIKNNTISFYSKNSKQTMKKHPQNERTGVGLSNMEQRLKIYFKNNYEIKIDDKNNVYSIFISFSVKK